MTDSAGFQAPFPFASPAECQGGGRCTTGATPPPELEPAGRPTSGALAAAGSKPVSVPTGKARRLRGGDAAADRKTGTDGTN